MSTSSQKTTPADARQLMVDQQNRPVRILLVDDDPDCRFLIRDAIAESNVANEVMEVSNGREALELLRSLVSKGTGNEPSLIYLDIEMPVMDGLTTLQHIKSDPALRHIPVVMMTGVSDEHHMRRAAELGANSYTLKPANAEQFLQTVIASSNYWLAVHQTPAFRLPQSHCRR